MAFNEYLAERVRINLQRKSVKFSEKKMMGGLTFMVNDKMCIGIIKDNLMCRIDPDDYEKALKKEGCKPMDFTGRPMPGYVFVENGAVDKEKDLEAWLQLCLDYNPKAKSSKKK